jgi:hypothetical protein
MRTKVDAPAAVHREPRGTARRSWLLVCACALATLLGLAAGPAARAGSLTEHGTIVYPARRVPITFDHRRHARLGTGCVYCHERATVSRASADRLLPPPARCDACHGTDHGPLGAKPGVGPAERCDYCHERRAGLPGEAATRATPPDGEAVSRVVLPAANLRFDHAAHSSRGIPCARCHAGVEKLGAASLSALPPMALCTSCHRRGGSAKSGCDVCHLTTDGGRLRTSFAAGKLVPGSFMPEAAHGGDWLYRHKLVAGADSAACATCHAESECVDCHDGRVRPRAVHPNDWLGLHAMAARQDEPSCTSCHRAASFCVTCHQRAGIAQSGPAGNAADRGRFHPPRAVWTEAPRTARHHAWEAERNITACVSCHTERDCASCHATAARGGQGGLSPHPPGFEGACATAFSKNPRPCLFCHDAGDSSLSRCR